MSDGTELRESWYSALDLVQSQFRQLLTSPASDWKRVPTPPSTSDGSSTPSSRPESPQLQLKNKGKARANGHTPDLNNVKLSRKSTKAGDVYRVQLDVTLALEDPIPLDSWKSILVTPEFRKEWDPSVESSALIEMLDPTTRISKTNFTLGWPAYPRDAVTISRTFNDATTLIDISTSLPRSLDEPAYLRPSPPYVRSDVKLFAWCVQYSPLQSTEQSCRSPGRVRITHFWQHDFRSMWSFGSVAATAQQLSAMILGLHMTVKERGYHTPTLRGYGNGVMIERMRFQVDRVALSLNYSVVSDEGDPHFHVTEGIDELHAMREARRLTRAMECALPSSDGWDVQVSVKASSKEVEALPWSARAIRNSPPSPTPDSGAPKPHDTIAFQIKHSPLLDEHSIMKVQITIEKSGSSPGVLRLNGIPHKVETVEERDPSSYNPGMMIPNHIAQDATSAAQISLQSVSTSSVAESNTVSVPSSIGGGSNKTSPLDLVPGPGPAPSGPPTSGGPFGERSESAKKSILSRVKRNYIYFSSLLQEPEAKWKPTTEARGVSVTQLDSIDPTLVVFRAEATFVGLGIWDLYSTIVTPGARAQWDRSYDDAILLEDVNELSEVWHWKSKPIWPANGRDAVVLKTVYKSPTTIHVFAFSIDDLPLFPFIPPVSPTTIRTQVDLQGWAIEALSPTTTLVTLLEQSDPKGWSNKNSIPQQMITAVAGVGEFVIKYGGPPVTTRLDGANVDSVRYDHDRGNFRIEYSVCSSRRTTTTSTSTFASLATNGESMVQREEEEKTSTTPIVECELRCDLDTWGLALDIVVDPPPQALSCLRRHRLSAAGGGVWITITHDAVLAGEERLQAIVRRGIMSSAKDKGLVMVNGVKVSVDVEEISETEVKQLTKQKRIKPLRVPLDQPPVMRIKRRKRFDDNDGDSSRPESPVKAPPDAPSSLVSTLSAASVIPKFSSPLTRFFTIGSTSMSQESFPPLSSPTAPANEATPLSSKPPMQYALDALQFVQQHHVDSPLDGWTFVGDKGCPVHRKMCPEVSPITPIHKGEKVIEGVSAEEVASVIASYDCRKQWDPQFSSAQIFQVFRDGCHTAFVINKGGFPFRDRGFYLASALARSKPTRTRVRTREGEGENSNDSRTAIFCVSASFSPESVATFSAAKYNPYTLPIGRAFVDGWILETLDPYTTEKYTIPSTRCTRLVAVDYAGSMPTATNTSLNVALARGILAVETYVKALAPSPLTRLPTYGFALLDKTNEANSSGEVSGNWSLRKRDHNRLSVATKYDPQARDYRSTLLVTWLGMNPAPSNSSGFRPRASSPLWGSNDQDSTPRPSPQLKELEKEGDDDDRSTSPQFLPGVEDLSSSTTSSAMARKRSERVSSFSGRSRSREAPRSSSSMFTVRGEVRQPVDLLVAEIVVDSRLYPGGYDIKLGSRIRRNAKFITLPVPGEALGSEEKDKVLPLVVTIHAMPSSPLHSSGLHEDRPPRHLLRLTLPTAQYHGSTLQDPLTGEIRTAPPKPQWLVNLQEKGGAVVDIEVIPANRNKSSSVLADGKTVEVIGEKEALTSLGREELLDNRASRSDILIRSSGDDTLPDEFQTPVAVAVHLLDPAVSATPVAAVESETKESEVKEEPQSSQDAGANSGSSPASPDVTTPQARGGGLLGFLGSYQNPLSHFSTRASTPSNRSTTDLTDSATKDAQPPGMYVDTVKVGRPLRAIPAPRQEYPLRVVILIALIAFLLGSLLRSLLSPSDFIYVVTDVGSLEVETGWREIRRLAEVKYLVGGWDFQIAVVRRH